MVTLDRHGRIDREALRREVDARMLWLATELIESVRAVAAHARGGQWVHADTANDLGQIIEYADLWLDAVKGEDGGGEDFPP